MATAKVAEHNEYCYRQSNITIFVFYIACGGVFTWLGTIF